MASGSETCPICGSALKVRRPLPGHLRRSCSRSASGFQSARDFVLSPVRSRSRHFPTDEIFCPSMDITWDLSERMRRAASIDPRPLQSPPGPLVLGGRLDASDEDHGERWHQIKKWATRNGYAYLLPGSIPDNTPRLGVRDRSWELTTTEPEPIPYGDRLSMCSGQLERRVCPGRSGGEMTALSELRELIRSAIGSDRGDGLALAASAATLPLEGVSRIVGFPDWLGYLGVILDEVGRHPPSLDRLAACWAPQFIRMGGSRAWMPYSTGSRLFTWRTLELAERQGLGKRDGADDRKVPADAVECARWVRFGSDFPDPQCLIVTSVECANPHYYVP